MDNPFDMDGNLTDIGRTVMDTDSLSLTLERAESGDASYQYRMGIWHLDGGNRLVSENREKAEEWLTKAAEQGYEKAKRVLEQMSLETEKPKYLHCYVCLAGLETYYCFKDCDKRDA